MSRSPTLPLAALAGLLLALSGPLACSDAQSSAPDELTIVVRGDRRQLEAQESALAAREQALKAEMAALDARIQELTRSSSKVSKADDEQRRRQEEELTRARLQLKEVATRAGTVAAERTEVGAKKTALDPGLGRVADAALSAREAGLGTREARIAEREAEFTRRERDLAAREKLVATREQEQAVRERTAEPSRDLGLLNGAASGKTNPREIPKASVIEQKHKKVLDELAARGLLIADLPLEDQPLNAEIWLARRQGDLARASDLLAELSRTAKQLAIDQKFIEQKMVRLQGQRASAKLSAPQRAEIERLLRDVTAAYSDGRHDNANRGLNRIAAILDAGGSSG